MLKIVSVNNSGDVKSEYIQFEAEADLELGNYAIMDTTYKKDGKVSNELRHVFFFKAQSVKKGEHVVLFSKAGTNHKDTLTDKKTPAYYVYWGLDETVWNMTGDKARVLQIASDNTFTVSAFKK